MATESDDTTTAAQGTVGEGRFYRPPSVAPADEKTPDAVGPEGRFYQPDAGEKPGESLAESPVGQASLMAGEPPTKADVRAAKTEAKAVEAGTVEPSDPAAETVQPDPVAAAADLAQDPPPETVPQPSGNASREEWAAYAKAHGASDADLLDGDGKPLGRDALREKYATS